VLPLATAMPSVTVVGVPGRLVQGWMVVEAAAVHVEMCILT
jgi:hypothetical protein